MRHGQQISMPHKFTNGLREYMEISENIDRKTPFTHHSRHRIALLIHMIRHYFLFFAACCVKGARSGTAKIKFPIEITWANFLHGCQIRKNKQNNNNNNLGTIVEPLFSLNSQYRRMRLLRKLCEANIWAASSFCVEKSSTFPHAGLHDALVVSRCIVFSLIMKWPNATIFKIPT